MKRLFGAIACLVIACGVLFSPASAAIVTLEWTGATAFFGNDGLGLFGPAGEVQPGTSYTATYVFDTSISFQENTTNGSQEVSGGVFFDPDRPVPLISAEVTINGVTLAMCNASATMGHVLS